MGQLIEQKRTEVKKHVATIHCSNSLGLLQRKISNALLFHAYPELQKKEEHEITVKQLCNIIGYNGNNHAVIKEALKSLISVVLEWNLIDEESGEEDWSASAIIASARIKGSKCTYAYSPRMRSLLFSPTMYGKINLIVQSRFKSSYGLALYENCVRYKNLPHTRWFELDSFRKLMGVTEDTYPIFRDFKKRVIDKSVEEVNMYSDMIVLPEVNRAGRKVVSIRFKLKEREKKKMLGVNLIDRGGENYSIIETALALQLKNKFVLSNKQLKSIFDEYSEEFIVQKLTIIESSKDYLSGKIRNLSGYLLAALKGDYQLPKSSSELMHDSRKEVEEKENIEKQKKLKEEEHRQRYSDYVTVQFNKVLSEMDSKQLQGLQTAFEENLVSQNNMVVLQKYRKDGLSSKIVKIFFQIFIKEFYSDVLKNIMGFEDYINNL